MENLKSANDSIQAANLPAHLNAFTRRVIFGALLGLA